MTVRAPSPAFTLTTCSRMEKAPDWTEIEMLLEMIGPAIQCMPSGVIHLLRARKLNWLKSLFDIVIRFNQARRNCG